MINFAICDDEKIFVDTIAACLEDIFNELPFEYGIKKYHDPNDLLNDCCSEEFDVLILDIDMPEVSGFDIAERIRKFQRASQIVFVSSKHHLVYNSFEYNPFYFICKSSQEQLKLDLQRAVDKLVVLFKQSKKINIVDSYYGACFIPAKSIVYINSEKHYLIYNTENSVPYKERATLREKEQMFFSLDFIKTHQRYLVNMNHIKYFQYYTNSVIMSNNESIPISKKYKESAFEQYKLYMRK